MPWNQGLTMLRDLLADLYPTEQRARQVVEQAGVPVGGIAFSAAASLNWHNILREADLRNKVDAIVAVACEQYQEREAELSQALQEHHLGAPRDVDTLPPIFQVPFDPNPNFTGRDKLLDDLWTGFTSARPGLRIQALTGLGGMGKTQLALEYAYRHAADYQVVWWVRAEEPAALAADYARLARSLKLPEADLPDQPKVAAAVCRWLAGNDGWLLIFDDVGDQETLSGYLPQGGPGHVLITSRNPAFRRVGGTLPVPKLDRADSVAFLLRRTGQSDETAAAKLAEALGDLPLALEQAGAYIERPARPWPSTSASSRPGATTCGRTKSRPRTIQTRWPPPGACPWGKWKPSRRRPPAC